MRLLSLAQNFVVNTFLGCHHRNVTRPFTIEDRCYMVCLDCGRQRFYSTETMRPLGRRETRRLQAVLDTQPAIGHAPRAYPKPQPAARPIHAGPELVTSRKRNSRAA